MIPLGRNAGMIGIVYDTGIYARNFCEGKPSSDDSNENRATHSAIQFDDILPTKFRPVPLPHGSEDRTTVRPTRVQSCPTQPTNAG